MLKAVNLIFEDTESIYNTFILLLEQSMITLEGLHDESQVGVVFSKRRTRSEFCEV